MNPSSVTRARALQIVLPALLASACNCDTNALKDSGIDQGTDAGLDAGCQPVGFMYGQDVVVDAISGEDDTKCACGTLEHPCKSLTYCMQLISEGATQKVTLHAQMSDGGPEWPPNLETWPVHLGWGVTLTAPDLYFNVPPNDGGVDLFDTYAFDAGDFGTVTIEGDPLESGRFIHVGVPLEDVGTSTAFISVADPGRTTDAISVPLVLSNIWAHAYGGSLQVYDGANVQLGPLPVHFGTNGWRKILTPAQVDIACTGTYLNPPRIFDVGEETVQLDDAELAITMGLETCELSLVHSPRIGSQPQPIFDGGCPPGEGTGVSIDLNGNVTLGSVAEPAVLSCQQEMGLVSLGIGDTAPDPGGTPQLSFTGTIANQRCFGLFATGGDITFTSVTLQNSNGGIWLGGDASLYLSLPYPFYGNDATGAPFPIVPKNDLAVCQQPYPSPSDDCQFNGIQYPPDGVLLAIEGPKVQVNLEDAVWHHWDPATRRPQVWTCTGEGYFDDCMCDGPDCPDGGSGPLQAGADVAFHFVPKTFPNFDGGEAGQCQ